MKLAGKRGLGSLRDDPASRPATQVISLRKVSHVSESVHVSVMGRDVSGQFGILAPSSIEIWHLGHDPPTRPGAGTCGLAGGGGGVSSVFSSFVLQRPAWLVAQGS